MRKHDFTCLAFLSLIHGSASILVGKRDGAAQRVKDAAKAGAIAIADAAEDLGLLEGPVTIIQQMVADEIDDPDADSQPAACKNAEDEVAPLDRVQAPCAVEYDRVMGENEPELLVGVDPGENPGVVVYPTEAEAMKSVQALSRAERRALARGK